MSGLTPQKDQLVHNNLAHKLLFKSTCGGAPVSFDGDALTDPATGEVLVEVLREGFSITKEGAQFILSHIEREVLSHREVKIMKDRVRPPTLVKSVSAPLDPALSNPDPNLSIIGIF